MRFLRQPRSILKWSGVALLLLIVTASAVSRHRAAAVMLYSGNRAYILELQAAAISFGDWQYGVLKGGVRWSWRRSSEPRVWWPGADSRNNLGIGWGFHIPLWIPMVVVAIPTAWLFLTSKRVRPGRCRLCHYDLAGVTGPCPECGTPR